MARAPKIIPNLRYEDPKTAIDWLCRAFGFAVHFIAETPGKTIRHAQLSMGHELIMVGPVLHDDGYDLRSPLSLRGQSQLICVAVEDVDGHFRTAKQAEAVIVAPPHDTGFGARSYTCLDLEGHIWSFSNYWGEPFPDEKK